MLNNLIFLVILVVLIFGLATGMRKFDNWLNEENKNDRK